ncbi:MAG: hypothetical protein LLG02_01665 [Pelosinus sp.]|nr:hypothetical protein [Pelosinus sp.]
MRNDYTEKQVLSIARECSEFEHLINAVNYGTSLLNISPASCQRRCPECLYWLNGTCDIFKKEIAAWR